MDCEEAFNVTELARELKVSFPLVMRAVCLCGLAPDFQRKSSSGGRQLFWRKSRLPEVAEAVERTKDFDGPVPSHTFTIPNL